MATDLQHDLEWCASRLRENLDKQVEIVEVSRVPSRLAVVHRLTISVDLTPARYYLKRYDLNHEAQMAMRLDEHIRHLSALSRIFPADQHLSAYSIVAADAAQGLILTREVAGESLVDVRRRWLRRPSDSRASVNVWHGVGAWLAALHWNSGSATASMTRGAEVIAYTSERVRRWATADPRFAGLADQCEKVLTDIGQRVVGRPVTVTLCHGDVSGGNILVHGKTIGLIDFDDLRLDMPGLDVSQALLEIQEYGYLGGLVPLQGLAARATAAFSAGYARPLPQHDDMWLPHLRNLSVFLVTLASIRRQTWMTRLEAGPRYRRTVTELRRTLRSIAAIS